MNYRIHNLDKLINENIQHLLKETTRQYNVNERTIELYHFIKNGHSVDCYGQPAFTNPKILENVWVIHFTDNGDDLANSHGFTFGSNDFIDLANTADGRDYPENPEKGFDFAFLLTAPSQLYMNCDDAFIFRASGILCQHQGEHTGTGKPMQQFIFWCDDTQLQPFYRITHKKTRWNGMIYDDFYAKLNGKENLYYYNEQIDMDSTAFKSMRQAIQAVIDDINGVEHTITKKLKVQRK